MKTASLVIALALVLTFPVLAQMPDDPLLEHQISDFVRRIYQDQRGHMWFGTNGDGVIHFDGGSLQEFSVGEGLGGVAVRGIVEDQAGNVWFGTEGGLSRWDGKTFTNFKPADGPANPGLNDVWALTIDNRGTIWVGTLNGASTFDGETFTPFELPETEPDYTRGVTSSRMVQSIMQDSRGRMWFATSGGVFIWDGKELENISEADGLCGDVVNDVNQAADGSFWFATHHHGVCRLKDGEFTHFGPADGVEGEEAWDIFVDSAGNVWFPTEHYGVYRFDGESFRRFGENDGLLSPAVQCTFEDSQGRIWVGGYRGLYRFDGERFVNLTEKLPWP
jgi:ligand-binding sensor domain-containing protein